MCGELSEMVIRIELQFFDGMYFTFQWHRFWMLNAFSCHLVVCSLPDTLGSILVPKYSPTTHVIITKKRRASGDECKRDSTMVM
jgi:hypothetical protein